MTKKTTIWVIFFAVLCIAAVGLFLLFRNSHVKGTTACIYVDGELYETIDLDAVAISYEMKIETENVDYNMISVEHGQICVSEASCPDQICVNQGWIQDSLIPITCLPNHLVIKIEENE